jgi:hypothetical protein
MALPSLHASAVGSLIEKLEHDELAAVTHFLNAIKPAAVELAEAQPGILGGAIDRVTNIPFAATVLQAGLAKLLAASHLLDAPAGPPPADPVAKPGG